MTDPTTVNILLSVPSRGSDSGTWDTPLNTNSNSIDGRFGGVQSISVSGSTTLSQPTGTASPGAGPTQAENLALKFTGSLASNATITLPLPGRYVLVNNCLGSALVMRASGTGNVVGLPPGEPVDVWSDGTNCDFVNLGRVGSYMTQAVATTPTWMQACTIKPYLICDGAIYSSASFTALGGMLGSTFGGNGITTFGVPDAENRYEIPLARSTTARITATTGGGGFDGSVLGTSGGSQFLQTHSHGVSSQVATAYFQVSGNFGAGGASALTSISTTGLNANVGLIVSTAIVAAAGTGSSGNIAPSFVAGVKFIKT